MFLFLKWISFNNIFGIVEGFWNGTLADKKAPPIQIKKATLHFPFVYVSEFLCKGVVIFFFFQELLDDIPNNFL